MKKDISTFDLIHSTPDVLSPDAEVPYIGPRTHAHRVPAHQELLGAPVLSHRANHLRLGGCWEGTELVRAFTQVLGDFSFCLSSLVLSQMRLFSTAVIPAAHITPLNDLSALYF